MLPRYMTACLYAGWKNKRMGYPSSALTVEQKILAALARIESKLDDTERRVKAVQQDVNRVKRMVRG
jgi:hypothetical protein